MIYALQSINGGPIKIGFSDDVESRRRQLESHYGLPLALLATFEGGRNEERSIHERFAHLRFGKTEQFRPAADLLAFIGRPLLVSPNPDAVEAMEPNPAARKPLVVQIRGSKEWKAWAEELAATERDTLSKFIERLIHRDAKSIGFREMPKR